jgi:hypothetical protein
MSPCRSDYIFTDKQVGVWHVVSEDSDHLGAWLAVVHCLNDLHDFEQPTRGEVRVRFNHLHALYELREIQMFRSSQWVALKEGNDRSQKITSPADNELVQILLVVVVSAIGVDTSHTEVLLHHLQALDALRALCHHKLMRHLEPGFVTAAICSLRLPHDVDRKASFTVDETSDPADLDQSFLLIARIRRIFTARLANTECLVAERVPRNTRIFQHIAKFY